MPIDFAAPAGEAADAACKTFACFAVATALALLANRLFIALFIPLRHFLGARRSCQTAVKESGVRV